MIEVSRTESGIIIKGHAGYSEPGKDIVCAGVSALVQTLIQSVEELTDDKISYSVYPGFTYIKFRNLSEKSKTLFDSFFIGVSMIAEEYPDNVRIA